MFKTLALVLTLTAPLAFAEYGTSWNLSLGCPAHGITTGSGSANISASSFSTSGGNCSRLSTSFAKFTFSGASGGNLRSSTVYPLQAGKLSVLPPLRDSDSTPLLAVEASCPTTTTTVNWIHLLSDASRVDDYFWGRSTMAPTSTTMTHFYTVGGTLGFSGSYSLPIGVCSNGVYDVSGTGDFQATMNAAIDWSGFYKTSPGNTTFFAPVWTITSSFLGSKTWAGISFNAQDGNSSKYVRVTSNAAGTIFTVQPFSNPETNTLQTGTSLYTETITISTINSPLDGMMRGTISRVNHLGASVGTTENIGCVVHNSGTGGFVVACGGKSPLNNAYNYALTFNVRENPGALDTTFNGTGRVKTGYDGTTKDDSAGAIALQADGKIVVPALVSGSGAPYTSAFGVMRFLSDGSLDSSFGTGGKFVAGLPSGRNSASAAVVQPDGKIIAVGNANVTGNSNYDFVIVRLNSDGSLDSSFGSSGIAVTPMSTGNDGAGSVALQPDGKIVVGGFH